MALFNKNIDYSGQDLHMLRNGMPFPLSNFFDDTTLLSYTYRLKENQPNPDPLSYEQITISEAIQDGVRVVTITADQNTNPVTRIDNFFVTVGDGSNTACVLIHLHDAIDKAWTSPSTLTIRKGMELKFGVLVSFTDGDYGDLSFYPEMMRNLIYDSYLQYFGKNLSSN